MQTMIEGWEFTVLIYVAGIWLLWWILYEVLVWMGSRRFPTPIYGPADLYRLKGPQAKQNSRVVR